jgi:hypothetical protein
MDRRDENFDFNAGPIAALLMGGIVPLQGALGR